MWRASCDAATRVRTRGRSSRTCANPRDACILRRLDCLEPFTPRAPVAAVALFFIAGNGGRWLTHRNASSGVHNPPPGDALRRSQFTGTAGDEAALDKLVERAWAADQSTQYAFAASLWKRAVAAATALHGGETLVTARYTLEQAASLCAQAGAEVSRIEQAALVAEAWALVSSVLPLLSKRMDDNTLFPGRCTKKEVEFYKLAVHTCEIRSRQ